MASPKLTSWITAQVLTNPVPTSAEHKTDTPSDTHAKIHLDKKESLSFFPEVAPPPQIASFVLID